MQIKDKALQITLVKKIPEGKKLTGEEETDESYADLLDATVYRIEDLMRTASKYVVGYIVLDTIRKVIVERSKK